MRLLSKTRIARRLLHGAAPQASQAPPGALGPIVCKLNGTLEDYPLPSFATHLSSSFATFGASYVLLSAIGFDAPALACAGVVSRLTKRFRMPLDLSLAAALANAVPWANALKLGPLLVAPLQQASKPASTSGSAADDAVGRVEKGALALATWAQGPVNRYGGPYVFVHWCTGLATVSVTTACVHHGVDVMQLLASVPYLSTSASTAQTLSTTASCVAGAMVINTVALPGRLYLLAIYGRPAFELLERKHAGFARAYRAWYRAQLREDPSMRSLERRGGP